jgi:serine/threonine kinase 17
MKFLSAGIATRISMYVFSLLLLLLLSLSSSFFHRGKYAAVRRCKHRLSGQQFAAKFLRKRRRSADLRPEILHEVAVLDACTSSTRIVRLHQVFESAHEMILLLEL